MVTSCIAEQAVDVVAADPDLVKLEFEAIVAANYPPSDGREQQHAPAVRHVAVGRVEPPGGHTSRTPAEAPPVRPVGRRPGARERSPPARTSVR